VGKAEADVPVNVVSGAGDDGPGPMERRRRGLMGWRKAALTQSRQTHGGAGIDMEALWMVQPARRMEGVLLGCGSSWV
jgi:hypothetical protein